MYFVIIRINFTKNYLWSQRREKTERVYEHPMREKNSNNVQNEECKMDEQAPARGIFCQIKSNKIIN